MTITPDDTSKKPVDLVPGDRLHLDLGSTKLRPYVIVSLVISHKHASQEFSD